jgi:hypothetical protein
MSEATLAKIATEALKPVSSFIDALLGPKLQRIRNWAEKQDLDSRLTSGVIDVLLEAYMRRLLRRICGITTIVFPQQSLPLTSIYEPLTLKERYKQDEENAFSLADLEKSLNFFVVDSAGMGKSTFAKHLVLEILNSTNKFPIFFELRRLGENESLLAKLAAEIDEKKKDIDERLLPLLLSDSEFVLILDGYDEVPEQLRKTLGEQITQLAVQCEKLQLIVTARPEVSLPELPNSKVLTIDPLTNEQAESLILRYDAVASIDVGHRLVAQFDNISPEFLATPLLVVLLYRTYGFNQSIATKITSFYDEVFNALYKGHDLSKAGFAREKSSGLDAEDFRRLLRGFSFLLAAKQIDNLETQTQATAVIDEAIRLTSIQPASASAFLDDLVVAVPLLVKEGTEYRFIHKSIGEFFAAEFLSYQSNSEQLIARIRDGSLYEGFINSFQFLSEINPSIFRRSIVGPVAKSFLEMPIENPYARGIRFVSPTILRLSTPGSHSTTVYALPADEVLDMDVFIMGRSKTRKYILGASWSERHRILPLAAWEAITEIVQAADSDNTGQDLTDFVKIMDIDEDISIDNERILSIADRPAVTDVLLEILNTMLPILRRNQRSDDYAIISIEACEKLLRQIEEENQTQGWLESLVAAESKSNKLS